MQQTHLNETAETIVRLDLDVRARERNLKADDPGMPEWVARRALDRVRTQRKHHEDFLIDMFGFDRACALLHDARMELDAQYRRRYCG